MTIDSFIDLVKTTADTFKTDYLDGNSKEPKLWPIDLSETEWWEQFNCFIGYD